MQLLVLSVPDSRRVDVSFAAITSSSSHSPADFILAEWLRSITFVCGYSPSLLLLLPLKLTYPTPSFHLPATIKASRVQSPNKYSAPQPGSRFPASPHAVALQTTPSPAARFTTPVLEFQLCHRTPYLHSNQPGLHTPHTSYSKDRTVPPLSQKIPRQSIRISCIKYPAS